MTIAPLLDALLTLRQALRRSDVLAPTDPLTIELPYDAGRRFELWLLHTPGGTPLPPTMTVDSGVGAPHRELTLATITLRWPLKLIARPDGRIVPEGTS